MLARSSSSRSLPIPDQRSPQPSSLTKPGARPDGSCPSCGSGRLTELVMTLTDGTPVTFRSCHNCEHRTWGAEGSTLELSDVLTRATKVK